MHQLANVFLELERHSLPATGSICTEDGQVGAFAQGHTFSTPSTSIGPYKSSSQSLAAILDNEIDMISTGEVSTFPVDNYLTNLWKLERAPDFAADATGGFYIKHFDDKGDHILVDEQHNITGIIDWEFASAESKQAAFASPCMMWPVANFYDGSNQLSAEELEFADIFRSLGREDMANIVLQGRKHQRFLFSVGGTVSVARNEFESLFQGLREALDGKSIGTYSNWKIDAIARASKDNPDLQRLMLLEQEAS